jgi:hypothetical protein
MGSAARQVACLLAALGVAAAACAQGVTGRATQRHVALGAEDDAAPWSYADGSGYANDLVRAAFAEAGWTLEIQVLPYARCKALAQAGRLAGCLSASRTAELEATLLFPRQPVFSARNLLLARADSPLAGCDPSRWGARPMIGLVRGYEYVHGVDALLADGRATAEASDSEVSNLRKLHAGRIAAAVVTVDEVKRMPYLLRLAQVAGEFKTVCDCGTAPAYVAFSRRHPRGAQALAAFDAGYAQLARRGAVRALQTSWQTRALDRLAAKKH